jgi:L-rhamnose mutarotase
MKPITLEKIFELKEKIRKRKKIARYHMKHRIVWPDVGYFFFQKGVDNFTGELIDFKILEQWQNFTQLRAIFKKYGVKL